MLVDWKSHLKIQRTLRFCQPRWRRGHLETCMEGRQLEANLICPEGEGGGRPRKSGNPQIGIGGGPDFENLGHIFVIHSKFLERKMLSQRVSITSEHYAFWNLTWEQHGSSRMPHSQAMLGAGGWKMENAVKRPVWQGMVAGRGCEVLRPWFSHLYHKFPAPSLRFVHGKVKKFKGHPSYLCSLFPYVFCT